MTDDPRRAEALETAFGLFLRYGYRKTSMDDVARAVGLSRQGLYVWYPNKGALFEAVVAHGTDQMLATMQAALATDAPLQQRLVDAFVGLSGLHTDPTLDPAHVDELFEASERLVGDRVQAFYQAMQQALVEALPAGPAPPEHVAEALIAASTGFKHTLRSPDAYREAMERTVAVICPG